MIDEEGHAVCIARTFAYALCLLRDFRDQYQDINLGKEPDFFWSDLILLHDFLKLEVPQERNYRATAEQTALRNLNTKASIITFEEVYGMNVS
jgi:hypothetical protein